ncbi:MAG: hypothetical protein WCQ47_01770 [bacterium]
MINKITISVIVLGSLFLGLFLPKYYFLSLLLMAVALGFILYKFILLKLKIKLEKGEIKNSVDSIIEGAEPEVIIRNDQIFILDDVKKDIYELARIFRDDVDFLRHDILDNIDIPIYIESSSRVFKNKKMKKICFDLKKEPFDLDLEFENDGIIYEKIIIRDSFFYFLPARSKVHSV